MLHSISTISETYELALFHEETDYQSDHSYGNYSLHVRTQLDSTAWIDFFPQWLQNSLTLFSTLVADIPWRTQQRMMYDRQITTPRLYYGYQLYQNSTPCILQDMGLNLSKFYKKFAYPPFASAGLCLYRDRQDSVAWHGDSIKHHSKLNTLENNIPQVLVAILTLGAARPLLLRPKNGGKSRKFIPRSGDLLVMGGTCQSTWEHCIPKSSQSVGARISIQFRPAGVH